MIFGMVKRIFVGEKYEWKVTLRPEEVLEKLGSKDTSSFFEKMFSPAVTLKTSRNGFTAHKMSIGNIPVSGNAFSHVLIGRVERTPYGSNVKAYFRMQSFYLLFTAFWLSGATLGAIAGSFGIAQKMLADSDYSKIPLLLFFLFFPVFGVLMMYGGRKMAAGNEKEVLSLVSDTLDTYRVSK